MDSHKRKRTNYNKELIDILNNSTFKNKPDATLCQAYDLAKEDSRYSIEVAKQVKVMEKYIKDFGHLTIKEIIN
jgi:hypothetical protein